MFDVRCSEFVSSQEFKPQTTVGKLLLHISQLFKSGVFDTTQRDILKTLTLKEEKQIIATLKAFEVDNDFNEYVDTLKLIARCTFRFKILFSRSPLCVASHSFICVSSFIWYSFIVFFQYTESETVRDNGLQYKIDEKKTKDWRTFSLVFWLWQSVLVIHSQSRNWVFRLENVLLFWMNKNKFANNLTHSLSFSFSDISLSFFVSFLLFHTLTHQFRWSDLHLLQVWIKFHSNPSQNQT